MFQFYNFEQLVGNRWEEYFYPGLLLTLFWGSIVLFPIYRRYLSFGWKKTITIIVLALSVAYYIEFINYAAQNEYGEMAKDNPAYIHFAAQKQYWEMAGDNPVAFFDRCLTPGLFILSAVPFFYSLFGKWFFNKTTETERIAHWDGFRAWLRPANLFCAAVVAYSYTASYENWPWNANLVEKPFRYLIQLFLLLAGLLLVYPLINTISHYFREYRNRQPQKESQADVQGKIIQLLDSGKITPQECVELLTAVMRQKEMNQPSPQPPAPPADSAQANNNPLAPDINAS